jgi:hypothetical protein
MKRAVFALAAVLCSTTAYATPILTTTGTWKTAPAACECGGAPWNGHSDDGRNHALAFVFEVLGLSDGLEWLAAPDGQPGLFTLTEWTGFASSPRPRYTDCHVNGIRRRARV